MRPAEYQQDMLCVCVCVLIRHGKLLLVFHSCWCFNAPFGSCTPKFVVFRREQGQ